MSLERSHKEKEEDTSVSLDVLLPDDLLEKILSLLPISIIRNASLVSKRWHTVVQRSWAAPQETALFFMFIDTLSRPMQGCAYNPSLRRWSTVSFPFVEEYRNIAACAGLVYVGDADVRRLFVCNPITGDLKKLPQCPLLSRTIPHTIAMYVDGQTNNYTIAIVSCCRLTDEHWDVSINVFESETQTWVTTLTQRLPCFKHSSVICNRVLYCLFSDCLNPKIRLLVYDLAARPRPKSFNSIAVPAPALITEPTFLPANMMLFKPWLMNLREKVVMVARLRDEERIEVVALGIWVLEKEGWREITRITREHIERRFNGVFSICCCGAGDFVYVHGVFNSPSLLTFDMVRKKWEWSECPIRRRNSWGCKRLTGFCVEPNFKLKC